MGGRVGEWAGAGQQATAMPHTRLYAGERLRALRRGLGLGQPAMAARPGLSVRYLSPLETDARPLPAAVITALRRPPDPKSVRRGNGLSVRLDSSGRPTIKTKNRNT